MLADMIHVAICDDEISIADYIESILLDLSKREGLSIETDVFCSGEELEKEVYKGTAYDLIYLDIQMEREDGISTAKNIREKDENVLLIYVSGYDRYMMELFRLDVFSFIRKPINKDIFERTFLEATKKIASKLFYFTFRYKSQEYKISCMDILYFASKGRQITVHIKNGRKEYYNGKLSDTEKQLLTGKIPFLRIHQSYLVNYHHINARSKEGVVLTDGTELPISEDRQKEFVHSYARLLGGEIDV